MAVIPSESKALYDPWTTLDPPKDHSLGLSNSRPHPTTGGKRPAETAASDKIARKKQKMQDCTQALEDTERALASLQQCLLTTKDTFSKSVDNEMNKDAQTSVELASLRKEILELKNDSRSDDAKTKLATHRLIIANKSASDARAAKYEAEERLKDEQDEHNASVNAYSAEVADLKGKQTKLERELAAVKRGNGVLKRKATKQRKQQEPRLQVIDAARQVQKMIAGVPVKHMGPLGEALQKIDSAIARLDQPER